jgi:GNAT superfamily N-acetyltransferase
MRVQLYDPSWKERVFRLTIQEYPDMEPWFNQRFEALYEHPYQEGRNRILLVTEGEQLAGMISYVYWPLNGIDPACRSFQMTGLIVSPDFRGRGIFSKLLEAMKQWGTEEKADFMIGFPVPLSRPTFVKKGWANVFDLQWFIKPLSLWAALRRKPFSGKGFSTEVPDQLAADAYLQTAADPAFWHYREALMPAWTSYWYAFQSQGQQVCIQFRMGSRKGLSEASIGKIYAGNAPASVVQSALKGLFKALRKEGSTVFASVAVNPHCRSETVKAVESRFFKIPKRIHFINICFTGRTDGHQPENWNLMRGDMETW